jgi:glycosyltransferase involved in cell wall biosynthesis
MGGVTALYEYANGLSRRGHDVHITHAEFWGRPGIASLDELRWFDFAPGITHHFCQGAITLPPADVIFGTGGDPDNGLPVLLIQGFEMFPKEMERAVFRTPCLKICVASWLREAGMQYGVPPDHVVYVPMGIDHDVFRMRTPLDDRRFHLGMLYSPHMAKGWVPGRKALELVRARRADTRAVIFGTESPPEALPAWITFVEDPDRDALARGIYNECRVFVQPSLYEGFGFTAVEAMACGCALVTTDNGGSRDYARPGETALLAEPGDVEGMARQIERLLADDDGRTRLARAGNAFVQRFQWDRAAELLEAELERYVADPDAVRHVELTN